MINSKGQMFVEDNDIIELMLANRQVKILPSNRNSYTRFEIECKKYGVKSPFVLDDSNGEINWNMPDEFKNLNVLDFILAKHSGLDQDQLKRVKEELKEFEQRDLVDLLRFLCYFVTILRSNNVIYGVGRGSSIASYVLYLLGVHRIDSYKFNLDIKEFLK
jgi:DNA polymerase III alpha subunit